LFSLFVYVSALSRVMLENWTWANIKAFNENIRMDIFFILKTRSGGKAGYTYYFDLW